MNRKKIAAAVAEANSVADGAFDEDNAGAVSHAERQVAFAYDGKVYSLVLRAHGRVKLCGRNGRGKYLRGPLERGIREILEAHPDVLDAAIRGCDGTHSIVAHAHIRNFRSRFYSISTVWCEGVDLAPRRRFWDRVVSWWGRYSVESR